MHIMLHTNPYIKRIHHNSLRKRTLRPYYTSSQSKCNFMWWHLQIKCVFLCETINASIMYVSIFLLYCACHLHSYCLWCFGHILGTSVMWKLCKFIFYMWCFPVKCISTTLLFIILSSEVIYSIHLGDYNEKFGNNRHVRWNYFF
jgi:hypothetical protein